MNIREIREILKSNKNIQRKGEYTSGQPATYKYTNLESFRQSINKLSSISIFRSEINKIKATKLYNDSRDVLYIGSEEDDIISTTSAQLFNQINGVILFINEMTKDEEEHLIYIKLPEFSSIDDFILNLSEVKKAVEIPSLEIGGEAKILNCEPGSIWITILLGSALAVKLIGKLVKIATDANLEIQKAKIFKNYAEGLKLNNEFLNQLKSSHEELLKSLIQEGAQNISDTEFDAPDNERVGRMKLAIKSISNLLTKGAQFLPSFKSSEEIKELYPKPEEETQAIENNVKSLIKPISDSIEGIGDNS